MFRFWSSDNRASEQAVQTLCQALDGSLPTNLPQADGCRQPFFKRSYEATEDDHNEKKEVDGEKSTKRIKVCSEDLLPKPHDDLSVASTNDNADRARDIISHQIGLEVLLKHDELRLINQELAKCQIALEQLRRCHLIPYPQHCPTPDQMLEISSGKGPAVITKFGEPVPQWAPPFGVTNGPYARHYAKWLIPDPSFDGELAEWHLMPDFAQHRYAEGRTTRNSFTETGPPLKNRLVRGNAGQKLQALSNGYPQPKDKAGPCILKRSDGQTVKLVCLDCNRENFSSTQGFINHCRIAHKRDFKSHEEAAVHSGQPIEGAGDAGGASSASAEDKCQAPSNTTTCSPFVHPFARPDISEQEAYAALRSRIADSLKLYHQGKLPGVGATSSTASGAQARVAMKTKTANSMSSASETPYLSCLMRSRNFDGNLRELVADAKTRISFEDHSLDDDSDDNDTDTPVNPVEGSHAVAPTRTPIVKRVPAQPGKTPASSTDLSMCQSGGSSSGPGSIASMSLVSSTASALDVISKRDTDGSLSDEDDDMAEANLTPNTLTSNNAPSLVSDDGEYDESDDASSMSGGGDELDAESLSDVAEISLDEEHDSRPLRRGSNGVSGTVRLRKDDTKTQDVTFLGSMRDQPKTKRTRRTRNL